MRLFSGLSFGRRGVIHTGVSSSGHPWVGARAGADGAYVGVRSGSRSSSSSRPSATASHPSLFFTVEDDGRVFLGEAELDVEDLREVIRASDEASNREGK